MLSPEGRCKTLDASADGYLRAEACGVLSLLPLSAFQTGKTVISFLAVLAGAAVNQDGRSSSLTAPNGPAQQQVIRQALESSGPEGLGPSEVSVLGMHGTGTPLGDPIEVGAVAAALLSSLPTSGLDRPPARPLPLTFLSSKSWVGHAEPASGIVGLVQACSSFGSLAGSPLLNLRSLNPHVAGALDATAIAADGRAWMIPRQAGGISTDSRGDMDESRGAVAGVSAFAYQVIYYARSPQ